MITVKYCMYNGNIKTVHTVEKVIHRDIYRIYEINNYRKSLVFKLWSGFKVPKNAKYS